MKRIAAAGLVICFLLGACALPTTMSSDPDREGPRQARNGDIRVMVPGSNRERRARPQGAAECAQYGRVARRVGTENGHAVYECVSPDQYTHLAPANYTLPAPGL